MSMRKSYLYQVGVIRESPHPYPIGLHLYNLRKSCTYLLTTYYLLLITYYLLLITYTDGVLTLCNNSRFLSQNFFMTFNLHK